MFHSKELFKEAVVRLMDELNKPRQIVGAYAVKRVRITEPALISGGQKTTKTFVKVFVSPMPKDKKYTGNVLLKYADGSSAFCSLEKGALDGMYERYAKPDQPSNDPLNVGPLLEMGPYMAGKREGTWNCPLNMAGIFQFAPRIQVKFKKGEFVQAQTQASFEDNTFYVVKAKELQNFIRKHPTKISTQRLDKNRKNEQYTR